MMLDHHRQMFYQFIKCINSKLPDKLSKSEVNIVYEVIWRQYGGVNFGEYWVQNIKLMHFNLTWHKNSATLPLNKYVDIAAKIQLFKMFFLMRQGE